MFDSLNREMLPPYGCDWVHAPNFQRLAEQTVVFDNCYAGSLPCMPARRELHTGRYNFLHRSWGPIEPFDDSMPTILKNNGVHTHLVSDHYHYWEDGGCTYHHRYSTWENIRGQEGDFWKGEVKDPDIPPHVATMREGTAGWRQDWVNRQYMNTEETHPQAITFRKGMEFIEKNHGEDNWFLQLETFDPHEPFFSLEKYKNLYKHDYQGKHFDWPNYSIVTESPEEVQHMRYEYAALLSMCDEYLGKVLDLMDEKGLWEDTMLIVNTDHGFLLGEKDWWAKSVQPVYNEVAHTPFFLWDPRSSVKGERRQSLVQTIDIAPTLLDFFNIPVPDSMQGKALKNTVESDEKIRDYALFGLHGGHVNITDGRYVYMRAPVDGLNSPLNEYTLMPTHMNAMFSVQELQAISLAEPFSFTKGCKVMKIPANSFFGNPYPYGTLLFDLSTDPHQESPLIDLDIEKEMIGHLVEKLKENESPSEQFIRLNIPTTGEISSHHLMVAEQRSGGQQTIGGTEITWQNKGKSMYYSLLGLVPVTMRRQVVLGFEQVLLQKQVQTLNEDIVFGIFEAILPKNPMTSSFLPLFKEIVQRKGK